MKIGELFNKKIYRFKLRTLVVISMVAVISGLVGNHVYANWSASHSFTYSSSSAPIANAGPFSPAFLLSQTDQLASCPACNFTPSATTSPLASYTVSGSVTIVNLDIYPHTTGCPANDPGTTTTGGFRITTASTTIGPLTIGTQYDYCLYYTSGATIASGGTLTVNYSALTP
jgi:hypothetical protein